MKKLTRSGVTKPAGFTAGGLSCGLKPNGDLDLAIIASDRPAIAAGLFTKNLVVGAPVTYSKKNLRSGKVRGIVINSGNSNVLTPEGESHAEMMGKTLCRFLGCDADKTLVASTGVIGQPLDIDKVVKGIRNLAPTISVDGGAEAARAIMTTDLVPKESCREIEIGGKKVTVGGCAKGSGMIHPSMGTMLAFITTDADVSRPALKAILKEATDASFNKITVDGDMSTSDMIIVMANGASGSATITQPGDKGYAPLRDAVTDVCVELAHAIVKDGEGATKFVTVTVTGAKNDQEADKAARAIAGSNLVKTALFGQDPNWGRILAAAGYSGARFDPAKVKLSLGGFTVFAKGKLTSPDWEKEAAPKLKEKEVSIDLDLGAGKGKATVWTCDLSYDYVRINADYRS